MSGKRGKRDETGVKREEKGDNKTRDSTEEEVERRDTSEHRRAKIKEGT